MSATVSIYASDCLMPRKKKETPPPSPESVGTETVRISSELVDMARYIVLFRKGPNNRRLKIGELVESLLREPLTREYLAERARQGESPNS